MELLAWNARAGTWVSLGQHTAADTAPATSRTLSASLPGNAADWVVNGRLSLLAATKHASSAPPGTVPSVLWSDFLAAICSSLAGTRAPPPLEVRGSFA